MVIFSLKSQLKADHWWNGGRTSYCSVHVVRQTVDQSSLSICYHEPPFKLDPQKALINGLSLVQGGDLGTMASLCGIQAGSLRTTWSFLLAKQN